MSEDNVQKKVDAMDYMWKTCIHDWQLMELIENASSCDESRLYIFNNRTGGGLLMSDDEVCAGLLKKMKAAGVKIVKFKESMEMIAAKKAAQKWKPQE